MQAGLDRATISREGVGGHLEVADRRIPELGDEVPGRLIGSSAQLPAQNQLRCSLDRNEHKLIADVVSAIVLGGLAALFLQHVRPRLINLHVLNGDCTDLALKQTFAVLARQLEDSENRSLLDIAQPGSSTHAVALHEAVEDHAGPSHPVAGHRLAACPGAHCSACRTACRGSAGPACDRTDRPSRNRPDTSDTSFWP